jgi:hypothetical protein
MLPQRILENTSSDITAGNLWCDWRQFEDVLLVFVETENDKDTSKF